MKEILSLYNELVDNYSDPLPNGGMNKELSSTLKKNFKIKLEKLLEDTKKGITFEEK